MRRDVQDIFRMTPKAKQVMMFSATMSKEIRPVCRNFMQDVCWCSHSQTKSQIHPGSGCIIRRRPPIGLQPSYRAVFFGVTLELKEISPSFRVERCVLLTPILGSRWFSNEAMRSLLLPLQGKMERFVENIDKLGERECELRVVVDHRKVSSLKLRSSNTKSFYFFTFSLWRSSLTTTQSWLFTDCVNITSKWRKMRRIGSCSNFWMSCSSIRYVHLMT